MNNIPLFLSAFFLFIASILLGYINYKKGKDFLLFLNIGCVIINLCSMIVSFL